jgi:hypothetical protein
MLRAIGMLQLIRFGVLFLLALVLVTWTATQMLWREGTRAVSATSFTPHLGEYLKLPTALPAGQPRPATRGGYLPIDLDNRALDSLYVSLPPSMRAGSPDDVHTVVWLRRAFRRVGGTGSRPKEVQTCRVSVIDRVSNVLVAETTFTGTAPPGKRGGVGYVRDDQIVAYLYSLQEPVR